MNNQSEKEIYSSRILSFPVSQVYEAFSNPVFLRNWWGPEGFTNTIHEFDLKPGGNWILTMHGPDKGNYENASIFTDVELNKRVRWKRTTQPLFDMEVQFEKVSDTETAFSFRMIFSSKELCDKIRTFAEPKNEENFDRLQQVLDRMNYFK